MNFAWITCSQPSNNSWGKSMKIVKNKLFFFFKELCLKCEMLWKTKVKPPSLCLQMAVLKSLGMQLNFTITYISIMYNSIIITRFIHGFSGSCTTGNKIMIDSRNTISNSWRKHDHCGPYRSYYTGIPL